MGVDDGSVGGVRIDEGDQVASSPDRRDAGEVERSADAVGVAGVGEADVDHRTAGDAERIEPGEMGVEAVAVVLAIDVGGGLVAVAVVGQTCVVVGVVCAVVGVAVAVVVGGACVAVVVGGSLVVALGVVLGALGGLTRFLALAFFSFLGHARGGVLRVPGGGVGGGGASLAIDGGDRGAQEPAQAVVACVDVGTAEVARAGSCGIATVAGCGRRAGRGDERPDRRRGSHADLGSTRTHRSDPAVTFTLGRCCGRLLRGRWTVRCGWSRLR